MRDGVPEIKTKIDLFRSFISYILHILLAGIESIGHILL